MEHIQPKSFLIFIITVEDQIYDSGYTDSKIRLEYLYNTTDTESASNYYIINKNHLSKDISALFEEIFIINSFSFYSSGIFTIGCYLNEIGTEWLLNQDTKAENKSLLETLTLNIIPDLRRSKDDFISITANHNTTSERLSTNASQIWASLKEGNFKKLFNSRLDLGKESITILHFITPFDEKFKSQIINEFQSDYNAVIKDSKDKICMFVSPCYNSQFIHLPGNNRIGRAYISSFLQNYPSPNTAEMTASFEMIKWINGFVFHRALEFSNNSMQAQILNSNFTNINILPKSYKEQINTYQLFFFSSKKQGTYK